MGKKPQRVYDALLDGASSGLTDNALYQHVVKACPEPSSKRIVKASLLALSDPGLEYRNVLYAIYALAIKYRLVDLGVDDDIDEDDHPSAPRITETVKQRLGTSRVLVLTE